MEDNEDPIGKELSWMIEYLIEMGAMEILGYDSISDQFTYQITSQCKDICPELYYAHFQAIGEMAENLWMRDIVDVIFDEGDIVIGLTQKQIEYVKENLYSFNDDERFFLETILTRYE